MANNSSSTPRSRAQTNVPALHLKANKSDSLKHTVQQLFLGICFRQGFLLLTCDLCIQGKADLSHAVNDLLALDGMTAAEKLHIEWAIIKRLLSCYRAKQNERLVVYKGRQLRSMSSRDMTNLGLMNVLHLNSVLIVLHTPRETNVYYDAT